MLFFSSCNEHESTITTTSPPSTVTPTVELDSINMALSKKQPKEWPKEIYDSIYGTITLIDTDIVTPMRPVCGYRAIYGWGLDHFASKPGKTVGVWPLDYSQSNLTTLKTHWGYSELFIDAAQQYQFDNAILSGYSSNDIMIGLTSIPDQNRSSIIQHFGQVYGYYIDEPADQNHSLGGIYRSDLGTSSFIISGYKRTSLLNYYVSITDQVLFSSYHHWYEFLPGIWWDQPISINQEIDWIDMKNRYGSKFTMTWINTYEITEFSDLFATAQVLQLNAVWIYGLDSHQTDQWLNISSAAWSHGFLRGFEQEYLTEWRCSYPNPCDCDNINPDGWYIDEIIPLHIYREVFQ